MEGDKYRALASNSVSQERGKLEPLALEPSTDVGRHQVFVVELLPFLSENLHVLGCKYFGRENPFKGKERKLLFFIEWLCQTDLHLMFTKTLQQG